jgi:hypothetical protein
MNTETNITPEIAPAPVDREPTQAKLATKKQSTKKKATPKPKTVKAKPAPKSKKAAKTAKSEIKLRPDGLREGSVAGVLVDGVCRKGGASHAELLAMIGWPGKQCLPYLMKVCQKAGVRLKKERKPGEAMRYYGIARKSRLKGGSKNVD